MVGMNLKADTDIYIKRQIGKRIQHSPDLCELRRQKNKIAVFVYGSLKQNFRNHDFYLDKATYLGKARTMSPKYRMYSEKSGAYPIVYSCDHGGGHFVYGEVYAVTADELIDLDLLEDNGNMYNREKVTVKLLDQTVGNDKNDQKQPLIQAFMYFGNAPIMMPRSLPNLVPRVIDNNPVGFHWLMRQ